jgi:pimeloyl-ACP methyl ester carboxylesterase
MMTTISSRRLRRGAAVYAKGSALGMVALVGLGLTYEMTATAADQRNHPAPGRLVDVGGFRMHIHCTGAGEPTIILDAGGGGLTSAWAWIQPQLAGYTRVCSYDRAGLGWSEEGSPSRDGVTIARELKALLTTAGEAGPYIHVGHSMGGIYGRVFAAEYPDEVVGLALVDASHPEQFERMPEEVARRMAVYDKLMAAAPLAARLGIVRATNLFGRMGEGLPAQDYAAAAALTARPSSVRTGNAEFFAWAENAERLSLVPSLGDLPLAVISAGVAPGAPAGFIEVHHGNQRELAALSANSQHEIVADADHLSIVTRQQHAAATTEAVLDLLATLRESAFGSM